LNPANPVVTPVGTPTPGSGSSGSSTGAGTVPVNTLCPPGYVATSQGCLPSSTTTSIATCPAGYVTSSQGCVPVPTTCPPGYQQTAQGCLYVPPTDGSSSGGGDGSDGISTAPPDTTDATPPATGTDYTPYLIAGGAAVALYLLFGRKK
jgi:hypothetical protein